MGLGERLTRRVSRSVTISLVGRTGSVASGSSCFLRFIERGLIHVGNWLYDLVMVISHDTKLHNNWRHGPVAPPTEHV